MNLLYDHPVNIPTKFGSNWLSGLRRRLKCEKFIDNDHDVHKVKQYLTRPFGSADLKTYANNLRFIFWRS